MKKFEDEQANFVNNFFKKMNFNRLKYINLADYNSL